MHYLAAYRINYIPQIHKKESSEKVIENTLAQISLWNSVQIQIAQTTGLSVELRIITSRRKRLSEGTYADGQTSLFILVATTNSTITVFNSDKSLRALESLLPIEYGWTRLSVIDPVALLPEGEKETDWRIARIVRRVEFVSLPRTYKNIQLFLPTDINSQESEAVTDNQYDELDTTQSLVTSWVYRRELPDIRPKRLQKQLSKTPFLCIPILGRLSKYIHSTKRLFQELTYASPVVISIVIHPIESNTLKQDRIIAARWRDFLEPFATAIANTGISDYGALCSIYERYYLPDKLLSNLSIRIATRDDAQSTGVAQHICSRLGGMRGFEVIPPTQNNSLRFLSDAIVDIPSKQWTQQQWQKVRKYWEERITDADVFIPLGLVQIYLDFLTRFPHLYTIEETEQILTLPIADEEGLAGVKTQMIPPFISSSIRYNPVVETDGAVSAPEPNRIRIGMAKSMPVMSEASGWRESDVYQWHTVRKDDLTKHAAIFGSTGSGKTLTALFLVRELHRLKVPFLIIEPVKTEYFDRLKAHNISDLIRFRFEKQGESMAGFLPFDPMRLQKGVSVARHASYLKSCFEAAFPMEPWLALVLESGLREYYTDVRKNGGCDLTLFTLGGPEVHEYREGQGVFPSLKTFEQYFCSTDNSFIDRSFPAYGNSESADWARQQKEMFRRRFRNLTDGIFGEACKLADSYFRCDSQLFYEPFSHYLERNNIILELDGVPDPEQKSLIMSFLMTFLFERRQADDFLARKDGQTPVAGLQHVLILEEAHRLLTNTGSGVRGEYVGQDSKAKATSLFVDMLAEIRAFGQGIMIVEQIPTKIVPEAIKNTNLKVMLRLTSKDDRDYLGETMNLTPEQNRFVTSLRAQPGEGVQFVVFEEGIDQPLLLSLPLPIPSSASTTWLYDDFFDS